MIPNHDDLCEKGQLYMPLMCYCSRRADERALIPEDLQVVYPWLDKNTPLPEEWEYM